MTIEVTKRSDYVDAGDVFDKMATGLRDAGDLVMGLSPTMSPGDFQEALNLHGAVDQLCVERMQTLEIYAEACEQIAMILRLCGEVYNGEERQQVETGSRLDDLLTSSAGLLKDLKTKLDTPAGTTPAGAVTLWLLRPDASGTVRRVPAPAFHDGLGPAVKSLA